MVAGSGMSARRQVVKYCGVIDGWLRSPAAAVISGPTLDDDHDPGRALQPPITLISIPRKLKAAPQDLLASPAKPRQTSPP